MLAGYPAKHLDVSPEGKPIQSVMKIAVATIITRKVLKEAVYPTWSGFQ